MSGDGCGIRTVAGACCNNGHGREGMSAYGAWRMMPNRESAGTCHVLTALPALLCDAPCSGQRRCPLHGAPHNSHKHC